MVLANGWSCSDVYWADVVPFLCERGHRVLLPDTRAHGESGLPRKAGYRARHITLEDMSVTRIARDLLEVCDDAGVGEAVFIGHSMGVQVILEAYRLAPERVLALVAVAGPYENPMKTFFGQPFADKVWPVGRYAVELMPRLLLPALPLVINRPNFGHWGARMLRAAGPKLNREKFAPYLAHLASRDPLVLFKTLQSMRDHSAADLLPELQVPLLVVAGGLDVFTPLSTAERMHELAPDSELVVLPEAGHTLPLEEPDELNAAIGAFLDRLDEQEAA